jgi:hypothetical protein
VTQDTACGSWSLSPWWWVLGQLQEGQDVGHNPARDRPRRERDRTDRHAAAAQDDAPLECPRLSSRPSRKSRASHPNIA